MKIQFTQHTLALSKQQIDELQSELANLSKSYGNNFERNREYDVLEVCKHFLGWMAS